MNRFIPLEFFISDIAGFGFMLLLALPILLLIALFLGIAKRKSESKKVLIAAGICTLIGAGFCGFG